MNAADQLNSLINAYNDIFKQCYDALAADAPQETRDALRESISSFLGASDTEE
jgi:hypothetical protein